VEKQTGVSHRISLKRLLRLSATTILFLILCLPGTTHADDGYNLWLNYRPLEAAQRTTLARRIKAIVSPEAPSATVQSAIRELQNGVSAMLSQPALKISRDMTDGALILGTPQNLPIIRRLDLPLDHLGEEGYLIRSRDVDGIPSIIIAANGESGLMYGAFALLRLIQSGEDLDTLDIQESPKIGLRLLNHWDNLDRSVERGYAGQSIWDWWRLPDNPDQRYTDYARANASIGLNGSVLNNVNASAVVLTPRYIAKAAALAEIFRPYGIRVYLSARFSAPLDIGGLDTADPLDPAVQEWWRLKADDIYRLIPDFGGFLVKANSEGQPGPQNYGRTHADGANVLASALQPHGGVVMWRAFVYSQDDPEDRVRQAYTEFKPLDGQFAENVLVQVKNGPLDFQPREPFHPMFGAMPGTPLMM